MSLDFKSIREPSFVTNSTLSLHSFTTLKNSSELSILKNDNNLGNDLYIDSLEVLARQTIIKSNRKVKEIFV